MDDTELIALVRRHLIHTSVAAMARQTGLNRNTIWDALREKHGINSRTRRRFTAWLRLAQVCAAFRQGRSVKEVAREYALTIAQVEQVLREEL
jgi:transposase-like protein